MRRQGFRAITICGLRSDQPCFDYSERAPARKRWGHRGHRRRGQVRPRLLPALEAGEFQREPPPEYDYPQSHIHVNAEPEHYNGMKPYRNLHILTGRRHRTAA